MVYQKTKQLSNKLTKASQAPQNVSGIDVTIMAALNG